VDASSWVQPLAPCSLEHVVWVDVAADAKNAFNSLCRSQMWDPLLESFPDLAALGRLMYGSASSIIFNESGFGRSEVLNSVGNRQGCSWGSFLYCLTIHPLLKHLADEFPGCVILAIADDVHIIGPPELAAAAYEELLQGELNDSKSKCYSPKISAEAVRGTGMPADVEIATDGTRVLGGPVGSPDYCHSFSVCAGGHRGPRRHQSDVVPSGAALPCGGFSSASG